MKKLLLLLLALPMFTTAQEKPVQVPTPCFAGDAFTIRIPVRFPDSMTVKYMWYRNDTAVTAEATLLPNEKTIAYTVPANEAYGNNVAFHFKYHLDDGYDEWTASRKYVITFVGCTPPVASAITGSATVCFGQIDKVYSVTNVAGTTYNWTVPEGWSIQSGQGTNSIVADAGNSASSGNISVTPFKDCAGAARTLAVAVVSSPQSSPMTGSTTVCASTSQTYSVDNVPGATYSWTVPFDWGISGGQNTNSITAWCDGNSGTVRVTLSNGGCSTSRSLAVTANPRPNQPSTITGDALVCANTVNAYSVTNVSGITYTWLLPSGWTGSSTTRSISVSAGTAEGTISVTPTITATGCAGTARTINVSSIVCGTPCSSLNTPGAVSITTPCVSSAGNISYSNN